MRKVDIIRLQHMLDAAREIRTYISKHGREEIEKERILALGLVKEIEIIGEAASNVSQNARDQIHGIEWREIIAMRNRLVHVYFEIDDDILWDTILYDIPKLIAELEAIPELQGTDEIKNP